MHPTRSSGGLPEAERGPTLAGGPPWQLQLLLVLQTHVFFNSSYIKLHCLRPRAAGRVKISGSQLLRQHAIRMFIIKLLVTLGSIGHPAVIRIAQLVLL
jgi:hypothetical protein